MTLPILTTERLVLRPFGSGDAPAVQRLAGDRAIAATTLRIPHPYADGMAEQWIANVTEAAAAGTAANFAVTSRPAGDLVGAVGLTISGTHRRAELGYWICKPFWNRGFATEAVRAVVRFGFVELDLHRIHACYLAGNAPSGRVLEKVGMQREGRLRHHVWKWDAFHDLEYYACLRDEFFQPQHDVSAA